MKQRKMLHFPFTSQLTTSPATGVEYPNLDSVRAGNLLPFDKETKALQKVIVTSLKKASKRCSVVILYCGGNAPIDMLVFVPTKSEKWNLICLDAKHSTKSNPGFFAKEAAKLAGDANALMKRLRAALKAAGIGWRIGKVRCGLLLNRDWTYTSKEKKFKKCTIPGKGSNSAPTVWVVTPRTKKWILGKKAWKKSAFGAVPELATSVSTLPAKSGASTGKGQKCYTGTKIVHVVSPSTWSFPPWSEILVHTPPPH